MHLSTAHEGQKLTAFMRFRLNLHRLISSLCVGGFLVKLAAKQKNSEE
ncbi:MAG: hypothetical protein RSD76_01065 [Clostridia bacterium]